MAIAAMLEHARKEGVDLRTPIYGNALIDRARNEALAFCRPDSEFVLFLDDDMLPRPDALVRLLSHQLPVVSALCTTRIPPVRFALKLYDEASDQFIPIQAIREDKVVTGPFGVGAAFLLMNRTTIEALKEYYFTARDWLDDNTKLLNRLHVRAEWREKERARKEQIRRGFWEREKVLRVFDMLIGENELKHGEDVSLSKHLIRLGIPISVDSGAVVGHLGEYPYGPWDVKEEEEQTGGAEPSVVEVVTP